MNSIRLNNYAKITKLPLALIYYDFISHHPDIYISIYIKIHHFTDSLQTLESSKPTMKSTTHLLSFLLLLSLLGISLAADSSSGLQEKCSKEFEKLTTCLDYASAKVEQPSSTCCTSLSGIKQEEPACLCYIIQQAHTSSSSMASMGVKFDRLLSLPDSCKLSNSSISNCPSKRFYFSLLLFNLHIFAFLEHR